MCYVCQVCNGISQPGDKQHRYQVSRPAKNHPGMEIAQEFLVCGDCKGNLDGGVPMGRLVRQMGVRGPKLKPAPLLRPPSVIKAKVASPKVASSKISPSKPLKTLKVEDGKVVPIYVPPVKKVTLGRKKEAS